MLLAVSGGMLTIEKGQAPSNLLHTLRYAVPPPADRDPAGFVDAQFVDDLPDSSPASQTDPLVAALYRGGEDAFEALVRRESTRMLATARRLLGSDQDAQDAVQDAFLQVHRHVGEFQGESKVSTWLHRIVVNAALMKMRSRRRKAEHELDELLPQFDDAGSWLRPIAEWERPSEELLESAETRAIVRRTIDRLPDSYREVLKLRDIDELDTEETAQMLQVSVNAVKVRLHRARQALRGLLEGELTA
jgi:RNA polymerase sigma-70 factor (ECF subfamily)